MLLPVDPAQVPHAILESTEARLPFRIIRDRDEHAHAGHTLALLRARHERPDCGATEQRDELPPSYVAHSTFLEPRNLAPGICRPEM